MLEVSLAPRKPVDKEEAKRITGLIAALAEIASPDVGFSSTLGGHAFSPIAGRVERGPGILGIEGPGGGMVPFDHKLRPAAALRSLVELGPRALPFLLDALNDRTPTRLTVKHDSGFGGMWLANELRGNPLNPVEQRVLATRKKAKREFPDNHLNSYTVKVGDVCLVAIGQIVGRDYQAVRYQPTACIVLNSPTEDAELCAQVRAIWSSKDPDRKLLDSLLLDYAT
jgi:hypothetical protein